MKKIIAVTLLAVSLFTLASCGGKKCDKCGQKITGEGYTVNGLGEGEKLYCETCHNEYQESVSPFVGMFGDLFG